MTSSPPRRPFGPWIAVAALVAVVASLSFLLLGSSPGAEVPEAAVDPSEEPGSATSVPRSLGTVSPGGKPEEIPEDQVGIVRGSVRRAGGGPRDGPVTLRVAGVESPVDDGPFEVRYRRGADRHVLAASARGVRTRRWTLPERVVDLGEVVLVPSTGYGGRVVGGPKGKPLAGVSVQISDRGGSILGVSGVTGSDGRYHIELVETISSLGDEAGRLLDHAVHVRRDAVLIGPLPAELSGLQGAHDLHLHEGDARVRFEWAEPPRGPVADAPVSLSRLGAPGRRAAPRLGVWSGRTDARGEIAFPFVPGASDLLATIDVPGVGALDVPLLVAQSQTVLVRPEAILEIGASVREGGRAVPRAHVGVTGRWFLGTSRYADPPPGSGVPLDLRGVTSAAGDTTWRVLLPSPAWGFRPERWTVETREAGPAENGSFPSPVLRAGTPLPTIHIGESRERWLPVRVVEGRARAAVVPMDGYLWLYHGGKPLVGGPVLFSRAPEIGAAGEEVWACTLPDAVVAALDARLMFDAPVFDLAVEGRGARRVPLRVTDFTEGLRRRVVAVLQVPAVERTETVRVVNAARKPVPGAVVAFVPSGVDGPRGGMAIVRARTDAEGLAELVDLEPGVDGRVVAFHPETEWAAQSERWTRGSDLVLESPRRRHRFDVRASEGSVEEVTVTLDTVPAGLAPRIVVRSDDSRVELPPMHLSLYRVRVEAYAPRSKGTGAPAMTHVGEVSGSDLLRTRRVDVKPVP